MAKMQFNIATRDDLRPEMGKAWNAACAMIDESDSKGIRVTVEHASRRSLEQNALLWVRLGEMSCQATWHGVKLTAEEWKDLASAGLMKSKVVPNLEGNGFVILGQRTSKMSVAMMADLISLIEALGSDLGVKFSANPREIA